MPSSEEMDNRWYDEDTEFHDQQWLLHEVATDRFFFWKYPQGNPLWLK
jgi:hypothetical protein